MSASTLGIFAHSRVAHEKRLPLHPEHLPLIDAEVRRSIVLESGYGLRFGVSDSELRELVADVVDREELIERSDTVMVMPQMEADDLYELRPGQTVWGWAHCMIEDAVTQAAIDKKLSVIGFEAMHFAARRGQPGLHLLHQNNELAGYCSVLHAFTTLGFSGAYGRRRRAVVLGFGSTARGAITALTALGVHDVTVLSSRPAAAIAAPLPGVEMSLLEHDPDTARPSFVVERGIRVPLADFLTGFDIVVNAVLQDPARPRMFLTEQDAARFGAGSVIIDVSVDIGMGFSWARHTSFAEPTFLVADRVHYYAVSHSPTLLWQSSTAKISEALIPCLATILGGPAAWAADDVIGAAIQMRDGVIVDPRIAAYQKRAPEYPHARIG